jgi:hypothetical protein
LSKQNFETHFRRESISTGMKWIFLVGSVDDLGSGLQPFAQHFPIALFRPRSV